jgi:hypothetical protein
MVPGLGVLAQPNRIALVGEQVQRDPP